MSIGGWFGAKRMTTFLEKVPELLYRFSWFLLVLILGYLVSSTKIWPHPIIKNGIDAAYDLSANMYGYFGLLPTRHVFPEPRQGSGVTVHKSSKMEPGVTFVSGFFDNQHAMKVLASDGRELHRWNVRFGEIFPAPDHILPANHRPLSEWFTHIHGAYPLSDGSVVFNFDQHGLTRIDACGKVMWTVNRMTHHSVSRAADGSFWVPARVYHTREQQHLPLIRAPFFEDQLIQVSADGKVLREISLLGLLNKNDLHGIVSPMGLQDMGNVYDDFMHTNDADVLSADVAAAFPQFETGDIAVSMRNLNLIFVFDPRSERVKWYQIGPWWRQHDPDFLKDGTISIFDNRSDDTTFGNVMNGSRIIKIDPVTRATTTTYAQAGGGKRRRFFTNIMGKHQPLANGNMLITESTGGRFFEATPSGEIVWQYINRFDDAQVALVTGAIRLPESYFNFRHVTCQSVGASQ